MIKLAITDIDGTLIKDGTHQVNPELFDIIRKLKEKGITFTAASGRQYPSIRKLFDPVHHDIIFVAENGAYVVCRDTEMSVVRMDTQKARELIQHVRQFENCLLNISTPESTYIESKDKDFIDLLVNGYHNNITIVDDLLENDLDIIKIAIYKKDGIKPLADEIFIPKWKDTFKCVLAGKEWLDFMDSSVDKGNALSSIQKSLRILPEETIAFGDNINDIGMLKNAGVSYAVETAQEEVKKVAKHMAPSFHDEGVIKILKNLLEDEEA